MFGCFGQVKIYEEKFINFINFSFVGGACRVGILWFQIEETAKQFPGVEKVQFLPEEIFQP
ncbi:MAG: hypothetical protein ACK413_02260 [Patescibacteria group bacterium]